MGYYLKITKYDEEIVNKIEKENLNFTFEDDKKYEYYANVFKFNKDEESGDFGERLEGKEINSMSAFYSFFTTMAKNIMKCVAEELPNFEIRGSGFDLTWGLKDPEGMTKKEDDFFYGIVPTINFIGDSSGWTWTHNELRNAKELLIKHNMWEETAECSVRKYGQEGTLGSIFDAVIDNKAVLELF